jgi:ribosome maturation factor RimP
VDEAIICAFGFLYEELTKLHRDLCVMRETGYRPFFCVFSVAKEIRRVSDGTEQVVAEIETLAEPLLKAEGVALIDVEYLKERKGLTLRVIVDKEEGVTLDDCASVSSQLGDLLDAKLEKLGPYKLEVSSPGLDRPLTKLKHFEYFKGRDIFLRMRSPVEGALDFRGVLMGVSDGLVTVEVKGQTVSVLYNNIREARLDY